MTRSRAWDEAAQARWIARRVGRPDAVPLTGEDLAALASQVRMLVYRAGSLLYTMGQPSDGIWIVRSGSVALTIGNGKGVITVAVLQEGDVDGDAQLVLHRAFAYTARAVEATECLFISAPGFGWLLETRPRIARRWLTSMAMRSDYNHDRRVGLMRKSLLNQVIALILNEQRDGVVAMSQATMASMLGASRAAVNRVLKRLLDEGLIEVAYAQVKLPDPNALAKRAGSTR